MNPADLLSVLFAEDDTGPAKAQAYAQALGGQQQAGLLGLLTGDKVLGGVGQQLLQGVTRDQGSLGEAAGRRQQAIAQRALAAQGAEADRARLTQQGEQQMGLHRYDAGQEFRRLMAQLESQRNRAGEAAKAAAQKQALDTTEGLRKELSGNPVTKQFQDVGAAYSKVSNIAKNKPSAAGDVALISSFMKIVDPGSSVKEGEVATAQNATNVPGQVVGLYNRVISGQRLTPEQRADFLGQSNNLYRAHSEQYGKLAGRYKSYAQKLGLNPADVVFGMDEEGQSAAALPGAAPVPPGMTLESNGDDAAALQWAQHNPEDPRAKAILALHGGGK